ncbi:MAG TPA: hypothetical protein VK169_08685 [Saprospiraceae bacterium]|nr:hypothetical protein [Saprospiraceae bacterium]
MNVLLESIKIDNQQFLTLHPEGKSLIINSLESNNSVSISKYFQNKSTIILSYDHA